MSLTIKHFRGIRLDKRRSASKPLGEPILQSSDTIRYLRPGNAFLNNITSLGGYHIFSDQGRRWVESQLGEKVNFDKVFSLELHGLKPSDSHTNPDGSFLRRPELPGRASVERYIEVYSSSFPSRVFPVISRSMFGKTLDLAYNPLQVAGSASSKACVYAFLSLISLFGFDNNTHGSMDCQTYASMVYDFTTAVIQESTVDGLQSLIMLVQHQYFIGDLLSAAATLSIATRLLYTLGAHTLYAGEPSNTSSSTYNKGNLRCHLRDLFWLCYSFDKDLCLRIGQPPCILDTHCDLTLPCDYVRLHNINLRGNMSQVDDETIPLFPWDLRLSLLKSKVYERLYSAHSFRQSESEFLSSIRSLDESLEQWRRSLPEELRPTLYVSQETSVAANLNTSAVMLRLAYYHCVAVIHQASSKFQDPTTDIPGPRLDNITSSTSLSTAASRSTLSFLHKVLYVVHPECVWVALFYAITAVLTLFCNILINPHDPEAINDMKLLEQVPVLIRRIPVRKLTLGDWLQLQYMDDVMTELANICAQVVSKSRKSSRDMAL
ncbi:hypothetical protein N7522_002722 [Penicillium canescens]|uniref:Xylanolytic transcriptional activator regulatory domain-containing protein n=1 Tax=Penicillium canescens TaxID=5083 RepID=A0AAD6N2Z7_PENCN|nr:hypothetical protein N7522_002722 [Penicillium canescens]KAJ6026398.1 hypothetical protein N7460_011215 [Penicillium canescens]